jgi:hypothetical protein
MAAGFYLIGIGATFAYNRIMVNVTQGTSAQTEGRSF